MSVAEMKEIILKVYTTESWKRKVEKMCDSQIIAIYHSFEKSGAIARLREKQQDAFMKRWNKAAGKDDEKRPKSRPEQPKQLTIDDYLKGEKR